MAVAFFTIACVIALNGAIGVMTHCNFPVLARASWSFYGAYIAIVSRVILAIFWFAIQTMNGANVVRVMIGAIWPSFLTLPNTIPADQGITTNQMISFVIFWLIQLPFLYMHPNSLRWLFVVKSIIVPLAWLAMMIWALVVAGTGPIFAQKAALTGSAYSWAWLSGLTSCMGNYATLAVNIADFSRYSHASVKWQWIYVPLLPIFFTFIAFNGIVCTSAGLTLYGTVDWDPSVLIANWDNRAAQFFAAFSFALAALGVNISANSLSAANDLSALFPRYINIRRGQLLCALISWCLVPWKILESAGSFLNFMSAYSVFLGPIASILVFDFWVVKQRKYDVRALYDRHGIYSYWHGVNWRAIVAFIVGIAPNMPGFIYNINSSINPGAGIYPYDFAWLLGFVGTAIVYVGLSYFFPDRQSYPPRFIGPDEIYGDTGSDLEGVEVASDENELNPGLEKRGFRTKASRWAEKLL